MNDRPHVTIAVTCYNRAHLIGETIESVLAQVWRPVDVVVVDDGSTDDTADVVGRFTPHVRYVRQDNGGVVAARNRALAEGRGPLFAFQDDDDLMPPDRIRLSVEALARHPQAAFVCGDWEDIGVDGRRLGTRSPCELPGEVYLDPVAARVAVLWSRVSPVPHSSVFRLELGRRIGGFDPRFFRACEDTDFFARLGAAGGMVYVPEVLSWYRRDGAGLSGDPVGMAASQVALFSKHLADPGLPDPLRRRLRFRLLMALRGLYGHELPPAWRDKVDLRSARRQLGRRGRVRFKAWCYATDLRRRQPTGR